MTKRERKGTKCEEEEWVELAIFTVLICFS